MRAAIALFSLVLAALPLAATAEPSSLAATLIVARSHCRAPQAERGLTATDRRDIDSGLTRWLDDRLAAAPRAADPDLLQQELMVSLGPQEGDGSCVIEPDSQDGIAMLSVGVRREGPYLLVHSRVGIACGTDDAAALYQWDGTGWRRFWRSRDGLGAAPPQRLAQVQADPSTGLVMALGHDVWCTSNWRQISLRLWRVAPGRTPLVLLDRSDFAFMAEGNGPLTGRLEGPDLYVDYLAASVDVARHSRPAVHHYRFAEGRLRRLDPFARTPADFVDEWLSQPWPGAATLTVPAAHDTVQRLHALLRGRGGAPSQSGEFQGEAQRCRRDPTLWQVRMAFADLPPRRRNVAFLLRWTPPDRFRMVAARFRPWPDCGMGAS